MDSEDVEFSGEARLVVLRGRGREALNLPISPVRLLIGFIGIGLCPAFCLGLLANQMGMSGGPEGRPALLSSASIFAGFYAAGRQATFEVLPLAAPAPPTLAPPAAEAIPEIELGELEFKTPESRRGLLRVMSLHLGEQITVRPFDADGRPDPDAFEEIAHLWRCRVTGHEQPIEPRLVRLLTTLNDIYDRPLHLISGHRVADTLQTKPTSQHVAGTAADVRVPGVSAQQLRAVAKALGARGVGLYTHKSFVHVDFRNKRRYFWVYPEVPRDEQPATASGQNQMANAPAPATGTTAVAPAAPVGPAGVQQGHQAATVESRGDAPKATHQAQRTLTDGPGPLAHVSRPGHVHL